MKPMPDDCIYFVPFLLSLTHPQLFSEPRPHFFSTYPILPRLERVLYSAVTYTLSGCTNALCNRPIPAHTPTHHHPARHPNPQQAHLARHPTPETPHPPPPGPTRPATHPTRPDPARTPSPHLVRPGMPCPPLPGPPFPHLDPPGPPPLAAVRGGHRSMVGA